ncbi:MAG: hypothetical protein ACTSRL_03960 [Candidatus Helarchaeota archaeon]
MNRCNEGQQASNNRKDIGLGRMGQIAVFVKRVIFKEDVEYPQMNRVQILNELGIEWFSIDTGKKVHFRGILLDPGTNHRDEVIPIEDLVFHEVFQVIGRVEFGSKDRSDRNDL